MTHPLAPYPDPEARDQLTLHLASACGGEATAYGHSVQGRPLWAVRVPSATPSARRVLITGNIHGVEWISSQVVLGVLQALAHVPGVARLRERAEIWAIPCLNPDGYARTFEAAGQGRISSLRPNAHGVDLNRNFPIPAGFVRRRLPGAGSNTPGAATYVGPNPLSEPETAALDALLRAQAFVAGVNGHSFMGKVIPPRVLSKHHWRGYKRLCKELRGTQARVGYGRLAAPWFDTFTGELEDHQHHAHRMWAVCLETFSLFASFRQHVRAPSLFWRFNPHDPKLWVQNDVPGIAGYLHAALNLPFNPP